MGPRPGSRRDLDRSRPCNRTTDISLGGHGPIHAWDARGVEGQGKNGYVGDDGIWSPQNGQVLLPWG